mgnify:CR=1 FL=1
MSQLQNFIYLEVVILAVASLLYPQNKMEVYLGNIVPFFIYIIESSLYLKKQISNPIQSTKILIYGFIFKMAFFAPFLLVFIYFYTFNTRIFVFSFLCSIILFHVLEAMIISSIFNKEIKKHK